MIEELDWSTGEILNERHSSDVRLADPLLDPLCRLTPRDRPGDAGA